MRKFSLLLLLTALGAPAQNPPPPQFQDRAKQAGLTVSHISSLEKRYIVESMSGGAGLIDCDNDGRADIYVTGFGGNALYHNLGNCKFEDVTDKAGVAVGGFSTGAAWADYDGDGKVDLFVSRYVHFDMNNLPAFGSDEKNCRFKGILVQCGPWGMQGESDFLFHNLGSGKFEDVSEKAGVSDPKHRYGLGVIWGDYDNDGWPDLYVANDVRLSILVTNFTEQADTLYHNLGSEGFEDVSWRAKLAQPTFLPVGWGTAFFDMDNDGWLDILVVSGHVYPQMDNIPGAARYQEPTLLFRNERDGTFEDVSNTLSGIETGSQRGAAFGDINNDGNLDVVIMNIGKPPTLLINQRGSQNHRVLFKLVGTRSNRMAIGARITVKAGKLTQINEVRAGGSYLSSHDPRLHFGLGQESRIEEVSVRWPGGKVENLRDVPADFIYTVVEGEGIKDKTALPKGDPDWAFAGCPAGTATRAGEPGT